MMSSSLSPRSTHGSGTRAFQHGDVAQRRHEQPCCRRIEADLVLTIGDRHAIMRPCSSFRPLVSALVSR